MAEETHAGETPVRRHPSTPLRVLVVCTANICRSAFAEVMMGQLTDPEVLEVSSAGIYGWLRHPVERYMAEELVRRGLDPSPFRSQRLEPEMIDSADVVLTVEASHWRYVLEQRPEAVDRTFSLGQFARGTASLQHVLEPEQLLDALRREQPTAQDEDDVVDPYGRGPEAAREAADHIERLLATAIPVLLELQGAAQTQP